MKLKVALTEAHKSIRLSQLTEDDEDYESDIPSSEDRFRVSPRPIGDVNYRELARTMKDDGHLKKLKRLSDDLKREKDELRRLAMDTKEAFSVCMGEVRMMLESKTADFFRVLIGRYCSEMQKRKQLHNQLVEINGNIRVFYRIRPQLGDTKESSAVVIDEMDNGVVHLAHPSGRKSSEGADFVIPMAYTQEQIFSKVSPIITSCIDGYNVCLFAYGHTGSGKTYTMEGPETNPGINQRAIMQLFEAADGRNEDIDYEINVSMMEIYNEKIRDLLGSSHSPLAIRLGEDGRLSIPGLREVRVTSVEHVIEVLQEGKKNKAVAATEANVCSSRSHVIVRVIVSAKNKITGTTSVGRLNLVDLAGSERVSQTNATGQLLKEAQAINKLV
ncbi:kinesin motor domain protein [Ancylostoma duodenale]|uniref:Kinesin-like protein n=1 Tax=Ancylostoma duodenale TaxID=51022 RepID=A0A0C2DX71_9BILA|nr:kinesin motor domain protein [Ancylostoma duodenale]